VVKPACRKTIAKWAVIEKQINITANVFVERLWRTVKQEEVYLKGYQNAEKS